MMYSFALETCCETSGSVSGSLGALERGKAPGMATPGVVAVDPAPVFVSVLKVLTLAGLEETSFAEERKALVVCSAHSEAGADTGSSLIFKDIMSFVS